MARITLWFTCFAVSAASILEPTVTEAQMLKTTPAAVIIPETQFDDTGRHLKGRFGRRGDMPVLITSSAESTVAFSVAGTSGALLRARQATLSPKKDLIAVLREAPLDTVTDSGNYLRSGELVIADRAGREHGRIRDVIQFQWAPDGTRLGFVSGRFRREKLPEPVSCGVWESQSGTVRSFPVMGLDIGWVGADTLLVQNWDAVTAVDVTTGRMTPSPYLGSDVSPDRRFSLRVNEEGSISVLENRTGRERWTELRHLLGAYVPAMEPFWVSNGSRGPALLCVSGVSARFGPQHASGRKSQVFIIDVPAGIVAREIEGLGIVGSADKEAVLVARGGKLFFVPLQ